MDKEWQKQFRKRINDFDVNPDEKSVPVSIKIRPEFGCFHREHSPEAYRLIDEHLMRSDFKGKFEEHESGPELLVYLALVSGAFQVAKATIELVTTIIKARSEGIKRGDAPNEPLELIIRGYRTGDEYFEEKTLRIPSSHPITEKMVEDVLSNRSAEKKKSGTKKKSKK